MNAKMRKVSIVALIIAVAITIGLYVIYSKVSVAPKKQRNISLIVYGNDSDRWENLKRGAKSACDENDADLTLVLMSTEDDYNEQIRLIEREVIKGADGILLAACDSKEIGDYLDKANIKIPIVMVVNGVTSSRNYPCVSADDYDMGYELGKSICESENPIIKVAIISDVKNRNNITRREQGVRDAIGDYASQIVTWERNENEGDISRKSFYQRELTGEAVDVIVTTDNEETDALMDALTNLNMTRRVYSISTSDKAVYYLDEERIEKLEYQTEFGIGYIGANYVLDTKASKNGIKEDNIKYELVDEDDMYDYENQMLIFPFVK